MIDAHKEILNSGVDDDVTPRVRDIIAETLDRRSRGELVSDEEVIRSHPDLVDFLGRELKAFRDIRQAKLAAKRAGKVASRPNEIQNEHQQSNERSLPSIEGYEFVRQISAGGQAIVFEAIVESTGRRVAVKVVPGGAFTPSRVRARFDREAKILASLSHPNIAAIIDRGRTRDDSFYLAMEYIDGVALDAYVATCIAPESWQQLVKLFIKIARVIHEAHEQRIVHRDLKPSNIRVDDRGEPHILDFGLATLQHADEDRSITMTGQIVGSLPWSSPEQAAGTIKDVSRSCDIYAIGVMLYQSLTTSFPYLVYGPVPQVLENILRAAPTPFGDISNLRFHSPPALESIVRKALAKAPSQRHPSAAVLAAELEDLIAGRYISLPPETQPKKQLGKYVTIACALVCLSLTSSFSQRPIAPAQIIELPSFTNSLSMKFVRIPKGRFVMGSPIEETGHDDDERTHPVTIEHDFYLGTTEVTARQYNAVMVSPTSGSSVDLPAQAISFYEASTFCERLSAIERRHYRLPTEAEWEYACRAGQGATYAGTSILDDMGWYNENSGSTLHRPAEKAANTWGLFDMHGNVEEWCQDVYFSNYLSQPGNLNPSSIHVVRGGHFLAEAISCRSGCRQALDADAKIPETGFRVVIDP